MRCCQVLSDRCSLCHGCRLSACVCLFFCGREVPSWLTRCGCCWYESSCCSVFGTSPTCDLELVRSAKSGEVESFRFCVKAVASLESQGRIPGAVVYRMMTQVAPGTEEAVKPLTLLLSG